MPNGNELSKSSCCEDQKNPSESEHPKTLHPTPQWQRLGLVSQKQPSTVFVPPTTSSRPTCRLSGASKRSGGEYLSHSLPQLLVPSGTQVVPHQFSRIKQKLRPGFQRLAKLESRQLPAVLHGLSSLCQVVVDAAGSKRFLSIQQLSEISNMLRDDIGQYACDWAGQHPVNALGKTQMLRISETYWDIQRTHLLLLIGVATTGRPATTLRTCS